MKKKSYIEKAYEKENEICLCGHIRNKHLRYAKRGEYCCMIMICRCRGFNIVSEKKPGRCFICAEEAWEFYNGRVCCGGVKCELEIAQARA